MNRLDLSTAADAAEVFQSWVSAFDCAVSAGDVDGLVARFEPSGYWKDLLALTWEFRTFAGQAQIETGLRACLKTMGAKNFRAAPGRTAPSHVRRSGRNLIEGYFEFDTRYGLGAGFVRLNYDPSDPYNPTIWHILTSLYHLHGFEERVDRNRPTGAKYSKIESPANWRHDRERERTFDDRDPEAVVVGAGQSGLMLAARLRQMGVDALVIEKTERIGDIWRNRYNNLTLHNELAANHFPYMPFPSNWPVYLPKDMLAEWLEAYAEFQELNVWTGTELLESTFDTAAKQWRLRVRCADGSERILRPNHLVAALGISGDTPKRPDLPGLADFAGTVLHSSEYNAGTDWKGKRALVVGTGNSGHDVAQDLHVGGAAQVSIMQRNPTCVVSLEPSAAISYSVYTEGRPTEDADLMVASIPYPVLIDTYQWITKKTNQYDKELLDGLRSVGFKTHTGFDETGFQLFYLRGAGGYYINVGCSELIIEEKIALRHAEDMDRFVTDGLRLKDGTVEPYDLVVLATGFAGMQENIRRIFGAGIADRVGPVWDFDEDWNLRNMWKRTGQEGFWVMGGALVEARLYSRFLALQIKASLEGMLPDSESLPLARPRETESVA